MQRLLCCTFAIGCAMDPTHPPVKVLLTDGLYQRLVSPVEQIHHCGVSSVPPLHLLFLPEHSVCHLSGNILLAEICV